MKINQGLRLRVSPFWQLRLRRGGGGVGGVNKFAHQSTFRLIFIFHFLKLIIISNSNPY